MTTIHTNVKKKWVRTTDVSFLTDAIKRYALTDEESQLILSSLTQEGRDSRKKRRKSIIASSLIGALYNDMKTQPIQEVSTFRVDSLRDLLDRLDS